MHGCMSYFYVFFIQGHFWVLRVLLGQKHKLKDIQIEDVSHFKTFQIGLSFAGLADFFDGPMSESVSGFWNQIGGGDCTATNFNPRPAKSSVNSSAFSTIELWFRLEVFP